MNFSTTKPNAIAGRAFIAVGFITIVLATIRFARRGRLLDDAAVHAPGILPDLIFSVILAAMLIALSAYVLVKGTPLRTVQAGAAREAGASIL